MSASQATALQIPPSMTERAARRVQRDPTPPGRGAAAGRWQDAAFENATRFFAVFVLAMLLGILVALMYAAIPAMQ